MSCVKGLRRLTERCGCARERGKIFVGGGAAFGACRAVSDGPERRVRRHSAGKSAAGTSSALVLSLTAIGSGDRITWQMEAIGNDLPYQHGDERACSTNGSSCAASARARPTGRAVGGETGAWERAGRRESRRSGGDVRQRRQVILGAYSMLPSDANIISP
jgi:hypothetical protein